MVHGSHALVTLAEARVPEVTLEQLQDELRAGAAVVLDVRDAPETWETGTIPGARNISRGVLEWFADPESKFHQDFMHPSKRVITFSMGGERSSVAAMTLLDVLGYTDVADFRAGLRAWIAAGLDLAPVQPDDRVAV